MAIYTKFDCITAAVFKNTDRHCLIKIVDDDDKKDVK